MKFIQNSDVLLGHGNPELRNVALDIVEHALSAVDPYFAVKQLVRLDGERLTVGNLVLDLSKARNLYFLGAGKATLRIAEAIEDILGDRIDDGLIAIKRGQPHNLLYVRVIEAAHPIPDNASFQAAKEALALANRAQTGDVIFTAITGGSSALLCYPPDSISLEEKRQVHKLLLECGADIVEINAVRKHLSRVKGGLLAQAALPAQLVNLTVSDVVGDHLDYIAGPVVPDTSYLTDAVAVLKKYGLWNRVAPSVREHLGKGPSVETPKKLAGKLFHSFVVGYEVGMLHQFKCLELLSQEQVPAGFPPCVRSPSALCFPASNAVSFGCSSRSAGRSLASTPRCSSPHGTGFGSPF